ncbi:Short-chain-enoyl-CoA hydratase [bioreactor metagenome]|uniref:Short-chain-enoyl-CoA hydratase n=1 Tax=bioreactor metagenome TaxID=1076179 RepID=A0A645HR48_9ZZZZ
MFTRLRNLPQIVIAAIGGYALGGGNELAMACDIRVASSRAKFGQPEVNLGLIPGFTGTQRLSRLVGKGAAKKMIFTTDMIGAEEAYRIGLVNKVVAPEALMRTVNDLALQILSKSVFAVGQAKRAINEGVEVDFGAGLAIENDCWTNCFSPQGEAKEGMTAFVEKRKPRFRDF